VTNPEEFIKDQMPLRFWPVIPTVLKTAYAAVEDMAKDSPILQVESAEDNRGRLISWAVDFGLKRAVDSGSLDCEYRWCEFAKPTGRYLELRFSHSTASVSQVANAKSQPRNVIFRENARLRTQGVFDLPEFEDEQRVSGMPHFILVHGYQKLKFAHFGVPSATSRKDWAWVSKNLMSIPHEIVPQGPEPEDTDINFDDLNLLKEDIERWRRDNGQ